MTLRQHLLKLKPFGVLSSIEIAMLVRQIFTETPMSIDKSTNSQMTQTLYNDQMSQLQIKRFPKNYSEMKLVLNFGGLFV